MTGRLPGGTMPAKLRSGDVALFEGERLNRQNLCTRLHLRADRRLRRERTGTTAGAQERGPRRPVACNAYPAAAPTNEGSRDRPKIARSGDLPGGGTRVPGRLSPESPSTAQFVSASR